MNSESTKIVHERKASSVESASEKIKRTVGIPGLVTEVMSSNTVILETVFSHLSPRAIKKAVLVSRTWRRVLETPKFWTKVILKVDNGNVSEVRKSKIIKLVSRIEFEVVSRNKKYLRTFERLIRAVVNNELSQLKTITTRTTGFRYDLSSISPELLSQAVVRLEECDLNDSKLSSEQVKAVLEKIIDTEDLKLKRFFCFLNLLKIPADLIMKASIKLEGTNVYSSLDSGLDWIKFVAESPIMKLKSLVTHTYGVPPDVLAAALVRVENVKAVVRSADQSLALFTKIVTSERIKLRKLDTRFNDLSHISSHTMAEAVVRLENVNLTETSLTPDQVQSIFTKISNCENLKLTELDISDNILSSVPADVLVKAISRLERVNMSNTSLTRDQVTAIFIFRTRKRR